MERRRGRRLTRDERSPPVFPPRVDRSSKQRDVVLALLVRYALVYAGGTTLAAYWLAVESDAGVALAGLLVAGGGVLTVVTSLPGTTGTSATALEPASVVYVDPLDFVTAPDVNNRLKAIFFGAGLVVFGTVLFVGLV